MFNFTYHHRITAGFCEDDFDNVVVCAHTLARYRLSGNNTLQLKLSLEYGALFQLKLTSNKKQIINTITNEVSNHKFYLKKYSICYVKIKAYKRPRIDLT